RLAEFITHLHECGVYFRSLHMGNIVLTPDNQLGLIDISDMRCLGRPLSRRMRDRNYRHLLRYENDWQQVNPHIGTLFMFRTRCPPATAPTSTTDSLMPLFGRQGATDHIAAG